METIRTILSVVLSAALGGGCADRSTPTGLACPAPTLLWQPRTPARLLSCRDPMPSGRATPDSMPSGLGPLTKPRSLPSR